MDRQQGTRKKAKTLEQRQHYYKEARGLGGDETEPKTVAASLDGSDNPLSHIPADPSESVKRGSVKGWFALHRKETLTTAIIALTVPIILGVCKWVIDIQAEQRYINKILDETRSRIEQLHSTGSDDFTVFVTKENLELKLELVERDLKALIPDVSGIEGRLAEIEKELEELSSSKSGTD